MRLLLFTAPAAALLASGLLSTASPAADTKTITVRNNLGFARQAETISVPAIQLTTLIKK